MKKLTRTQKTLLLQLSDGLCHSGEMLGEKLGISRTAVWKQIKTLETFGLLIQRRPKQGYCLKQSFIPLSQSNLLNNLKQTLDTSIECHVFASIDSTNRFLKTHSTTSEITCCLSETQTAGRGRFGRHWYSPFGENIYFSFAKRIATDPSSLSGLSLVVSLAIYETLTQYTNEPIRVKWPNDLLWQDKKLAGTLIEITAEGNSDTTVIIGMGININSLPTQQKTINKPWCSLREITHTLFDRNQIIAELIKKLHEKLELFLQKGFSAFQNTWNALDYLNHQTICVSQPNRCITGKGLGVNELGYLLLEDLNGEIHTLSAGDTSLFQQIRPEKM